MKKVLLILPLFIISCGKEMPKCESFEVKQTVLDIIKEERLNSLGILEDSTEIIESMDTTLILSNIRTENINEEIQKCDCEGTLEGYPFKLEDLNDLSKLGVNVLEMKNKINLKFNAQINAEGETIVEVEPFSLID